MKGFQAVLVGLGIVTLVSMMSCASTGPVSQQSVGTDESVVVIQRKSTMVGVAVPMRVYIDGEYRQSVASGKEARFVVPNGEHTIWAGSTKIDSSSSLPFMVNHEEVTFFATPKFGLLVADFEVAQTGKRALQ